MTNGLKVIKTIGNAKNSIGSLKNTIKYLTNSEIISATILQYALIFDSSMALK